MHKTDGGREYPASAYAYVPDPEKPSTWKIRLEDDNGQVTLAQLGRAAAALSPGGFRGQKADIPSADLPAVKAKIRAAYHKLGVKDDDIPESVREQFDAIEPIEETAQLRALDSGVQAEEKGWVWESEMLKPGLSMNGRYYPPEFIRRAAPAFEGAPCFADHQHASSSSVRNLVGKFQNVTAPESMRGELRLLKSEGWVREKLLAAEEAGLPIGLSIAAFVAFDRAFRDGREVMEAKQIIPGLPLSVDLVTAPAAGGRVLRAVASADTEALLAEARKKFVNHPAPGNGAKEQITMEEVNKPDAPESGAEVQKTSEAVTALEKRVRDAEEKQQLADCRVVLRDTLDSSKLPEPLAALVREQFADKAFKPEDLEGHIKKVREAYAAVAESPTRLDIRPGSRIAVVSESADRMQVALDKLFGLSGDDKGQKYDGAVPAFRGIREAYIAITGDREVEWFPSAGRTTEEWNAAGFTNALGNTLYRRLVADYRELDFGLNLLVPPREPHRVALQDFRTHEIVRVGYLGDLTQVDPEAVDWPEIAAPTDEKATIAAVQFGGIVTVTRKTIINDDIGLVAKVASRIGRAAARTLARRIIKKWIVDNPNVYDGAALFNAGGVPDHKNRRTVALAAAELNTIRQAMRDQTEKDSGEKLGLSPYILLVPHALEGTARQENEREYLDATFTPNPVRAMYGPASERIIVSPLLTDVTDYFTFANPDEVQTFEIGFLQGRQEPELLLADNQMVGKAFTSDRIQYKVRHEYETTVVDFRGAHGSIVAG